MMREEIAAAVVFVTRLLKQKGSVPKEKADQFSNCLSAILVEKFRNHWYIDKPTKGQGYRCIRISPSERIDPVLQKAASDSGVHSNELDLQVDMTLWVDPEEVSCRFGESYGSLCTLASSKNGNLENRAHIINIEEILEQERERHNQQVNIVTTRSTNQIHQQQFSKGLYYGKEANFYTKQQHNYYNNNMHNESSSSFAAESEEQVNGVRTSPEHVNEVREQFKQQVSKAVGKAGTNSLPHKPKPQSADKSGNSNAEKKPVKNTTSSVTPNSSANTGTNASLASTSSTQSSSKSNIPNKAKSNGAYPTTSSNGNVAKGSHTKPSHKSDAYHWGKNNNKAQKYH